MTFPQPFRKFYSPRGEVMFDVIYVTDKDGGLFNESGNKSPPGIGVIEMKGCVVQNLFQFRRVSVPGRIDEICPAGICKHYHAPVEVQSFSQGLSDHFEEPVDIEGI